MFLSSFSRERRNKIIYLVNSYRRVEHCLTRLKRKTCSMNIVHTPRNLYTQMYRNETGYNKYLYLYLAIFCMHLEHDTNFLIISGGNAR